MHYRRITLILIFICFLISCKRNPDILVEVNELDFKNKTADIIHGKIVIPDLRGAEEFLFFDSLILAFTTDPSGQLQIFSGNTYEHLGSFCSQGRARNEFIRALPTTNQIFYNDQNHVVLLLMDSPNIIKEVDITESLIEGHTVVLSSRECLRFNKGVVIYLDNNLNYRFEFVRNKYEANEEKTNVPSSYTLIEPSGKKKKIKIFSSKMDIVSEKSEVMPYSGTLYKHPKRNLIVQSFSYMEYLLFFDFDNNRRFAIHQKKALSFNDSFDRKSRNEKYYSFTDAATSEKYFMILYWRGDYFMNVPNKEGNIEVLAFDWEGNYVKGFKLDRKLVSIEYDEKKKTLYGLDANENIYSYDLEGLLQ